MSKRATIVYRCERGHVHHVEVWDWEPGVLCGFDGYLGGDPPRLYRKFGIGEWAVPEWCEHRVANAVIGAVPCPICYDRMHVSYILEPEAAA